MNFIYLKVIKINSKLIKLMFQLKLILNKNIKIKNFKFISTKDKLINYY